MDTKQLPPPHVDTAQQKVALRRQKAARWVRKTFPRGTRVEATVAFELPGNGRFGTIVGHIASLSEDGGRLIVLWDEPNPFGGGPHITRSAWAGGLLVVDPATGRGMVRPGLDKLQHR